MTFKTIDKFVEYNMAVIGSNELAKPVCAYIVTNGHVELLRILLSDSNVPSKYDLTIISCIHRKMTTDKLDDYYQKEYEDILDAFTNRKE